MRYTLSTCYNAHPPCGPALRLLSWVVQSPARVLDAVRSAINQESSGRRESGQRRCPACKQAAIRCARSHKRAIPLCVLQQRAPGPAAAKRGGVPDHPQRLARPCEPHIHAAYVGKEPYATPSAAPVATAAAAALCSAHAREDDDVRLTPLERVHGGDCDVRRDALVATQLPCQPRTQRALLRSGTPAPLLVKHSACRCRHRCPGQSWTVPHVKQHAMQRSSSAPAPCTA